MYTYKGNKENIYFFKYAEVSFIKVKFSTVSEYQKYNLTVSLILIISMYIYIYMYEYVIATQMY